MRFLIIDDSSVDRHALASLLEILGHEVDLCASAIDALGIIEVGKYDLVFLDVVMPEQDGYKFLRTMRLNPKTASQYVVFYSSKTTPLEVNYGIQRAGANDYLSKPVSHESIERILSKIPA
ncbi:response regulator [Chamaesiphon minutus]|uniref:Response regulator containing a CheY-like receiver domain and a GGDEF domain n=1 Tax=Chamaesiphon minutus (strain ATCC 27169 / PCC 6605) TaxID=1173020 RepID=K9UL44_CHAP6|nr:response regulator [Chamaesiphon minutus]AFY95797.1 response regulator containing a CheY-like receiver domain and a GGDEF domain [Chamaesiphon minutus PCC 6605]